MAKIKFEESMQKLEDIVSMLENGELTLEESLSKYESGIKIYKQCSSLLEGIEKKIVILTKDGEENLKEKDFSIEE